MTTFIFDFDGTIADTLDTLVAISNRLAPDFGIAPVTAAELKQLREVSAEQLVRQSGVPFLTLLRLLRRVRRDLQREIPTLHLIPGMAETLSLLAARGHRLGIVTSNSEDNVKLFLSIHGLQETFQFVHTGASLFGKSRVLRRVLRQHNLPTPEAIYVGDETRDVDASRKIGLRVVAVTWGFNSRHALSRHQPDFLVDQPYGLIAIADAVASS